MTGRRRRGTSPSVMLLGVAASILVVGFLLGRWSTGFGGTGENQNLSSVQHGPGYLVPDDQLVVPPAGHVVFLAVFKDREWRSGMDIAQAMASDRYPSARLVPVSKAEGKFHVLLVAGTEGQMRTFANRLRSGSVSNPAPGLITEQMWETIEANAEYGAPL